MKVLFTIVFLFVVTTGQIQAQLNPAPQENFLQFNDDLVKAAVVEELKLSNEFTMSCWISPTGITPYAIIMGKTAVDRNADPYMSYVISWSENGKRPEFVQTTGEPGSYVALTAPADAPLNTWTHVAATLQNGIMKLFINGQEVGSINSPGAPPVNEVPFAIGGGITGSGYCCGIQASLMQASVWSKALTASEITLLAENIPTPDAEGLIAFWKMDEAAGQVVQDLSGNKINLQLGTSPTSDGLDPEWVDNSGVAEDPFFTLHQNSITISHELTDIFPLQGNNHNSFGFIGTSIEWPPLPPPGVFRPLEYLAVENMQVVVKTTEKLPGSPQMVHARHSAQGDFNGDGLNDFIIIGHGTDTDPYPGEQSRILIQQADGSFNEETTARFPEANDFTHHVSVGDIDGDGDLDVYFANIYGGTNGPRFLLNNGSGIFTVSANALPSLVAERQKVYTSSALADFDNDDDLDLYLGADQEAGANLVLFNNGKGLFELTDKGKIDKKPDNTWIGVGVAVADFDNDGDLDIISNNTNGNPFYQGAFLQLLQNDGTASFSNHPHLLPAVTTSGTVNQEWVVWVDTVDINNDGWMDLIAKGVSVPDKIFINYGGTFQDMTHLLPVNLKHSSGIRAGDFDKDGDQDLITIEGQTASVLENTRAISNSVAHITASGEINYCPGASVNTVLTAFSAPDYTFQWLKDDQPVAGATSASYTATSAGAYKVVSRNGENPATTSQPVNIQVVAEVPATITLTKNKLVASEGNSYKWYLNGGLLDFSSREITPAASGEYQAEVIQANGCSSISHVYQYNVPTGLQEFDEGKLELELYPNPSGNGELVLYCTDPANFHDAIVQVLSIQGKILSEFRIKEKKTKLFLPDQNGIYIIKVARAKDVFVHRVVKN